jgi:hypothetical protein
MKHLSIVPTVMKPSIGRIVHIVLTQEHAASIKSNPHFRGKAPEAEEVYPLIITRVWPKATYDDGLTINGQLIIDGFGGIHWMTSVRHGDQPGQWRWPQVEHATELKACARSAEPLKNASGIAADIASPEVRAAVNAETIERLKEELARVRKHETHLIQDRDRLIHKDIANLQKQLTEVIAERDDSRDRERRLSERLANIASLVSDM